MRAFHETSGPDFESIGGMGFVRQVRPAVFVPMHGFGDTAWYAQLEYPIDPGQTRIFEYRVPGDGMHIELHPDT